MSRMMVATTIEGIAMTNQTDAQSGCSTHSRCVSVRNNAQTHCTAEVLTDICSMKKERYALLSTLVNCSIANIKRSHSDMTQYLPRSVRDAVVGVVVVAIGPRRHS